MKKGFIGLFSLLTFSAFGQASVAYYPWSGVFSVSTNPTRVLWLDGRFQTNTLFGQLNTTVAALVNLKRTPVYQFYTGPGVQFSAINASQGDDLLQNFSLHVGVRVSPFRAVPNVQGAFEIAPTINSNLKSGVLYSRLGIAYFFRKRQE